MVHNHPSGDPNPSKEDIVLTKKIIFAISVYTLVYFPIMYFLISRGYGPPKVDVTGTDSFVPHPVTTSDIKII